MTVSKSPNIQRKLVPIWSPQKSYIWLVFNKFENSKFTKNSKMSSPFLDRYLLAFTINSKMSGLFFGCEWKSEVKWSEWVIRFGSFDFYETFICFRYDLRLKQEGGKKLQKNFLMGLKFWWSWGSRIFFSKSS